MKRALVVVNLDPEWADAAPFRTCFESDPELVKAIELRFARDDDYQALLPTAEVIVSGHLNDEQLHLAEHLRWVAFWSAGLDGKISEDMANRHLLITNASGVHGPNISEHVMAWMLMFNRRMNLHMRSQMAMEWTREGMAGTAQELSGQTLGIIGLGRIGEALAQRAKAFGMRVIAVKRNASIRHEPRIEVDHIFGPEHINELLGQSDHVVVCVPYSSHSHHLLDADRFAAMKPTAYLYNISRGSILDEEALIAALEAGTIAGAGLDVFETEPLPSESPLWAMDNVLITPHAAGITPYYFQRFAPQFATNVKRYLVGYALFNQYDPHRGY